MTIIRELLHPSTLQRGRGTPRKEDRLKLHRWEGTELGRDGKVQSSYQAPEAKLLLVSLRLPSRSAEPWLACVSHSAQLPAGFLGCTSSA